MDMVWLNILVLIYAVFLSSLHFLFERLYSHVDRFHNILMSYGAGSLLAIIFLIMVPEAVHSTPTVVVYPLIMVGYAVFLLTERYLYQHVKPPKALEEDLYHLHAAGFFIDHFIKGFVLVTIVELEPVLGFLTAIPLLIQTLSSSITMKEIHEVSENSIDKVFLSSSTVAGTLIGIFLEISPNLERYALAFVSGLMLFLLCRDIMPKRREGKTSFFIFGAFTVFIIWLGLEYLFV